MTWCEALVTKFNDQIKLDQTRIDRVTSAIEHFQAFARADPQLSIAADGEVFLQGSIATKTTIRPTNGAEFDVDAVYPFRLNAFPFGTTPNQIIEWFTSRLKESDFYKTNLIPRDRCARIDYAGDFHVDIIPATSTLDYHQPFAVPAKDLSSWITNDPLGFVGWVEAIDTRSNGMDSDNVGRFVRCSRIMKRWRDSKLTADVAPTSILLVTMLGKHEPSHQNYSPPLSDPLFPNYKTDIAYLYDMLRLTHSCLLSERKTAFMHPTIPNENLSREWDGQHLNAFLDALQSCVNSLEAGIYSQDEAASAQHYRHALGDTFPLS